MHYIVRRLPRTVICDRDARFLSLFWQTVMRHLSISARTTSGFHPQANGQAERTNQTLRQYLRVCAKETADWPAALNTAEMAINNAPVEGTKYSPFLLNLGYHPCLAPDTIWEARPSTTDSAPAKEWLKTMQKDWQVAHAALAKVKAGQARRANAKRLPSDFYVGDEVMVRMFPVNRTQLNKSGPFADRWAGPYLITEQVALDSFRLELPVPEHSRLGRVFNAIELKPYFAREPSSASIAPRVFADDRTLMDDFPSSEAEPEEIILTPNSALPRWQQQMEATSSSSTEPSLQDVQPEAAEAPPISTSEEDREAIFRALLDIYRKEFPGTSAQLPSTLEEVGDLDESAKPRFLKIRTDSRTAPRSSLSQPIAFRTRSSSPTTQRTQSSSTPISQRTRSHGGVVTTLGHRPKAKEWLRQILLRLFYLEFPDDFDAIHYAQCQKHLILNTLPKRTPGPKKSVHIDLSHNVITKYAKGGIIKPFHWKKDKNDVKMSPQIFHQARRKLYFKPGVDLFASAQHKQLPRY
jgi:hypothetical protein